MAGILTKKPHAVCLPFPASSHVNAMLIMAKILHHKGFHITFVHTEYNYKRTIKSRGPNSLDGSSDFRFETIPDGLANEDAAQDVFQLCISMDKNCHAPFLKLLRNLNNPVTCVISDGLMAFTLEASQELGVPNAQIWTVNAAAAMTSLHIPHLVQRGYIPLKDESFFTNGYLDQTIDWIPGIRSLRLGDLPVVISTNPKDAFLEYILDVMPRTLKGSALIINTFDTIESEVLNPYSTMVDHLYTLGPIHLLLRQIEADQHNITTTESIQSNIWKEDDSVIEWLNSKEKGSVVYVNFGSLAVLSGDQLLEFAWGLSHSMQNFLWIIRPDLVTGGSEILPPEFFKVTMDRGMVSTWCNQELVLDHPSVGAFLTHCGWNSILESLSAGVPLICWPLGGDQFTNCFYCCSCWGVGVEIDKNVDTAEVEKVVKEVMQGHKGIEMKHQALAWKKKAEEAVRPGVGSSFLNLDKLIEEVLLQPTVKP